MKKIKRVLAVISAAAALTVSAMPVSAYPDNGTVGYDLTSPDYIAKVDSCGKKIYMEEEFVDYLNSIHVTVGSSEDGENFTYSEPDIVAKHVYGASLYKDLSQMSILVEDECYEKYRTFTRTIFFLNGHAFRNNDELMEKYTVEEMNDYLKEQGFKAHLKKELFERNGEYYYNMYYDDTTEENIIGSFLALNKKYSAVLEGYGLVSEGEHYEIQETEKEPETLKGDADLNGTVDLADLTTLAKYNLNNKAYPLANDTAYANADINGDGVVDGLDTCALIEEQLGHKKTSPKKDYIFDDFLNMSEEEVKAVFEENGVNSEKSNWFGYVWTADDAMNGHVFVKLAPDPYMINETDHKLITRSQNGDDLADESEYSWDMDKIYQSLELPEESFDIRAERLWWAVGETLEDGNFYESIYCHCFLTPKTDDQEEAARLLAAALNYVQLNPDFEGFYAALPGA